MWPSLIDLSTQKNTTWNWVSEHKQAFDAIKQLFLHRKTFAYFSSNAYTEVVTDTSRVGVGSALAQQQLNEMKYSQVNRRSNEILLIIDRFPLHLYDTRFTNTDDHELLVHIFWTEHWMIRLMPYAFTICYKPGSLNCANYLSQSNLTPWNSTVTEWQSDTSILFTPMFYLLIYHYLQFSKPKTRILHFLKLETTFFKISVLVSIPLLSFSHTIMNLAFIMKLSCSEMKLSFLHP